MTPFRQSFAALSLIAATSLFAGSPGAERAISKPRIGPAFGSQVPVAMAFHGDEGFIVWNDTRSSGPSSDVSVAYGSRIDAAGNLLDAAGIRLGIGTSTARDVLWAGDAWVALYREGGLLLSGIRFDRDGRQLGERIMIAEFPGFNFVFGRAVTNGRTIAIPYGDIFIASLDLRDIRKVVPKFSGPVIFPEALTTDGFLYEVFGAQPPPVRAKNDVVVASLTESGDYSPISHTGVVGSVLDAVWTGRDFLVLTGNRDIEAPAVATRFDVNFTRTSTIPLPYSSNRWRLIPSGDGEVLVTWTTGGATTQALVLQRDTAGEPFLLQQREQLAYQPPGYIAGAATVSRYVLAGDGIRTVTVPHPLRTIPPALNTLPKRALSPAAQLRFAASSDPPSDVIAFMEQDGVSSRVMVGRLGEQAHALLETGHNQYAPAIASDGNNALVAWFDEYPNFQFFVLSVVVSNDGTIISPLSTLFSGPLRAANGMWPPAALWTGSVYLVANDLFLKRVLANGTVLDADPGIALPTRSTATEHLSFARIGDGAVATWMTDGRFFSGSLEGGEVSTYVETVRLTRDGLAVAPAATRLSDFAGLGLPTVAVSGDVALILSPTESTVYATRFSANGARLDPAVVRIGFGRLPTVARHGDGFLVAWTRSAGVIEAVTVSRDLKIGLHYLLTTDAFAGQGPIAFTTSSGNAAVAYVRVGADTDFVPRLYMRTFDVDRTRFRAVHP